MGESRGARGRLVFGGAGEIGEGEKETERGLHVCQVISPLAAFHRVSL